MFVDLASVGISPLEASDLTMLQASMIRPAAEAVEKGKLKFDSIAEAVAYARSR